MIVSKVRSSTVEVTKTRSDEKTGDALHTFLFTEITDVDPVYDHEIFLNHLEPLLLNLKNELNIGTFGKRRRSLKRVLLRLTTEVTGETRIRLSHAFKYFGFVDETISEMHNSKWWIRAKGCRNVGLMMNTEALPILEQCLDDENDDVRTEAAQAMLDIGGVEIVAPILMRLRTMSLWMQVRLSRSILTFGEHAVVPLVKAMKSMSPVVQGFCVELLGILGDVKAVPTVLEYIDYSIPEVKHKSLIALGKIGDARSIPVLQKFLSSPIEQLRVDAAKAAGNLASPSLVHDLHKVLLKDTMPVKLAAAEALARTGELGIKSLVYAVSLNDENVRMVAMQFLHEAGVSIDSSGISGEMV